MRMVIKVFWSYKDGQDGSHSIKLHSSKEEALNRLDRTEEELEDGDIYNDGSFGETLLEVDGKGNLLKEVGIYIE